MGHNTKLAGHHVQLRITLTRLTSDYRGEQPYCSTQGEPKRRVHLSTCQLPPRFSLSPRFLSSSYFRVRAVHLSIYSPDLMCITRDRIRHNAFENHYFPSRNPTQISFSICIHVATTTALFPALQRALLRNRIRRCLHASILLTIAYGRYAVGMYAGPIRIMPRNEDSVYWCSPLFIRGSILHSIGAPFL